MKVLIQDLETMCFLATNGRLVADKEDAQDFFSLLPAYNFARDNTSLRFQVLLYCPEDKFCASIIAGIGVAHHQGAVQVAEKARPRIRRHSRNGLSRINGVYLPDGFDEVRWNLN